jgi:hypothetical protein
MNLKNSISEFRQFQRRRKELVKRKMLEFKNVRFQRRGELPHHDVTITVRQCVFPDLGVVTFKTTGVRDFFENALMFNDCLADVTKMEIMFESEPDILLKFPHPSQKETFANALKHFLALR